MKLIGKPTINPIFYYSGKFSGYGLWVLLIIPLCSKDNITHPNLQTTASWIFLCIGLIFTFASLANLGKSTRLGIPREDTQLKTHGFYKISRNPMYVGFNMFSISAILFFNTLVILILGFYSIMIYHFIILGEERFLENRFGEKYLIYKKRVRRYL